MEHPLMLGVYALCAMMPFYVSNYYEDTREPGLYESSTRLSEILACYVVLTFSFGLPSWSISLFYLDSFYYTGIILSIVAVSTYLSPWFHELAAVPQRKIKYSLIFLFYLGLFLATGSVLVLGACLAFFILALLVWKSKLDLSHSLPMVVSKSSEELSSKVS